ncbi:MAG: ABC transporter ATP-binding protein [Planctomycetota bacterium]|nr:ABC transporter ATP-binding protein [Planctomycetota bacterium]
MNPVSTLGKGLHDWSTITGKHGDLLREQSPLLGASAFALVFEIGFALLAPWPVKYIFDGLLMPSNADTLPFINPAWPLEQPIQFLGFVSLAVLLISLGQGIAGYFRTILSAIAGQRMMMKLRKRVYSHLLLLSMRFHKRQKLGDLLVRITGDVPMLRDVLSTELVDFSGRLVQAITTLSLMAWIDPQLSVVSLVVLILITILARLFSVKITKVAKKQREHEGDIAFTTGEGLTSLKLIKSLGRESEVVRKFARKNRSSLRQGVRATRLQAALSRWTELIFAGGLSIVLLAGAYRVHINSDITPGDLLVFISYVRSLQKPLRKAARLSGKIGKASACAERISEILRINPEEIDLPNAIAAPPLQGNITFKNVTFSYQAPIEETDEQIATDSPEESRRMVLDDVCLDIKNGEHLVLCGPNGAGKSTLTALLSRLYEPEKGAILIDGVPITSWTLQSLRDQISIVLQESFILSGSVREHLEFHRPEATDEEMYDALKKSKCDFILDDPSGLDRELSEGGQDLSGGEKRRLTLSTALLRNSPIVILDEPTTAIDPESRRVIQDMLLSEFTGKTLLLITHDEELMESFDSKLVLEAGRVVSHTSGESGGTTQ